MRLDNDDQGHEGRFGDLGDHRIMGPTRAASQAASPLDVDDGLLGNLPTSRPK
jgi:hypothetical protein